MKKLIVITLVVFFVATSGAVGIGIAKLTSVVTYAADFYGDNLAGKLHEDVRDRVKEDFIHDYNSMVNIAREKGLAGFLDGYDYNIVELRHCLEDEVITQKEAKEWSRNFEKAVKDNEDTELVN
ncbi:MAG: hypothetical protein JRJ29_01525 [Deltaproteobacteria bacterium]|nr:hypothetical protein [Deltaproteobacteria bacterium]